MQTDMAGEKQQQQEDEQQGDDGDGTQCIGVNFQKFLDIIPVQI